MIFNVRGITFGFFGLMCWKRMLCSLQDKTKPNQTKPNQTRKTQMPKIIQATNYFSIFRRDLLFHSRFVLSFIWFVGSWKLAFNWRVLIIILNMCLAFNFPCLVFVCVCAIEFALLAHKRFINWPLLLLLLLLLLFFILFPFILGIFYIKFYSIKKMNWNTLLNYICNFNFFQQQIPNYRMKTRKLHFLWT